MVMLTLSPMMTTMVQTVMQMLVPMVATGSGNHTKNPDPFLRDRRGDVHDPPRPVFAIDCRVTRGCSQASTAATFAIPTPSVVLRVLPSWTAGATYRFTHHFVIRLHPKITERLESQSDWRLSALVQSALEWRAVVLHCLLLLRL